MPPYPDKPLFMDGHWWTIDTMFPGSAERYSETSQEYLGASYTQLDSYPQAHNMQRLYGPFVWSSAKLSSPRHLKRLLSLS